MPQEKQIKKITTGHTIIAENEQFIKSENLKNIHFIQKNKNL